jgi:hypothetical protein
MGDGVRRGIREGKRDDGVIPWDVVF